MSTWDAIVIGGGHNGLVAGAYLARAGARVAVLEARSKVGGAAATDAPWPEAPEIKVTRLSYVMSLMPPGIVRELDLERHGYKLFPMGPAYQAWPDGRSLTIYDDDARRNHEQISKFSKRDADAMPRWDAWLEGLAAVLGPLLTQTPPRIGSRRPSDLADLLRLAWRYRGLDVRTVGDVTRLMTMSVSDLLDDWFESEQVKASLAINGVIGTWAGPDSPGTAYVMAHHSIGDVGDGHLGSWGFPEGGMGAVSDAIHRSAVSLGATVRTGARVERVLVSEGRATGVALAGGEELHAPVVVTAIHPRTTFLEQVDRAELPADFVTDIERWKTRSGTVKVNLATERLPEFSCRPGFDPEIHGGTIVLAESLDDMEGAFQDAAAGRPSALPFADVCIPSVFDKTLAPEGHHIVSMFTQWVPHTWAGKPMDEELEAHADRVVARMERVAPGFTDSILFRQVIGPYQMEHEYGLVGGNIFHGELSASQLFHTRPAAGYADYRTPIRGLYQAGSATHGGGGVTGIPGRNVVRQISKDLRRSERRRKLRLPTR